MKSVAQTIIEADRFYTIAAKTGSVIQAVESVKDGGNIRLGKYERKPEQEWAFVREGDGVYRIRNRASGKLIDLMMTGTANGTWLHLWEDVGGTSQMWKMEPTPAGTVRLRSMWAAGKCIDTVGMGTADGAVKMAPESGYFATSSASIFSRVVVINSVFISSPPKQTIVGQRTGMRYSSSCSPCGEKRAMRQPSNSALQ